MDRLQQLSGWNILVDFPTCGNSHLDNCFMNWFDFFTRCYPSYMSAKSHHQVVILPAGSKLHPMHCKVLSWDRRLHRKQDLYVASVEEDWQEVLDTKNVNEAVNKLETTIWGSVG